MWGMGLWVVGLLFWSTFVVDVAHWLVHRLMRSPSPFAQRLSTFHRRHHQFFSERLTIDTASASANLWLNRLPALGLSLGAACLGWPLAGGRPVALAAAALVLHFVASARRHGQDVLHRPMKHAPAPLGGFWVDGAYHALHHASQRAQFGLMTTLFDRLFGTGIDVAGRIVVLTGASGAFGAPFKALLERAGATVRTLKFGVDYGYDDYSRCQAVLADADVLVLAHGAKKDQAMAANCDSFVALIEQFKALTVDRQLPPEVWAVGSEIEAHPSWGNADLEIYLQSKRAFARHARRYFHDQNMLYRHIVPSAFTSPMGPGLISGRLAAAWAWFFIKRGFRYVPVSYTGIALINYLKFVFKVHAAPNPSPAVVRFKQ